ncbi:uncharacterized protein LOC121855819 isoform X2 [Homarus americanus]|nr:uncharacterized protein LOC121855819 isoform X2 [Homarus americanus]
MSGSGSSVVQEVKATEETAKDVVLQLENASTVQDENKPADSEENTVSGCGRKNVNITNVGSVPGDSEPMQLTDGGIPEQEGRSMDVDDNPDAEDDITIHENEVFEFEKEGEIDEAEESCFKIDKVYSVTSEQHDDIEPSETNEDKQREEKSELNVNEANESAKYADKGERLQTKDVKKEIKEEAKMKEEKQIKPKAPRPALAKVPSLTGGVGGVRMLGGGVRGTSMPLIVSMGAGNPGIPLLPAGLPPGRYVILPGTSTTSKTNSCATVTTMSANLTPRLATSVAASATRNLVAAQKALTTPPNPPAAIVPQPAGGTKMYTRERGRRKSYTAGEKLAMIEAVEAGQRKSVVADRFGVAPSTLACILAQKNKIRAEQDNLARRRVRHPKYAIRDDLRGKGTTAGMSTLRLSPPTDHPFTHFLAPLSAPTPTLLDTQPEEIIAVPDLVERMTGGTSGGSSCKADGSGDGDDDDGSMGINLLDTETSMEPSEYLHDHHDMKSRVFHQTTQLAPDDVGDDTTTQDTSGTPSSPTPSNQGLVGPYLLKKETHCSTVLDQLLRDDTYTDVTLTAEGQSLRAHRVVLCLASPYFRQVLSRELNIQSVVLLRDIKFAELRNIIHFIYT